MKNYLETWRRWRLMVCRAGKENNPQAKAIWVKLAWALGRQLAEKQAQM